MHTATPPTPRRRRRGAALALPGLAAAGALTLAACGTSAASPSGGGTPLYGSSAPSSAPSASNGVPPAAGSAALTVRSTSLGSILTDGRGLTVYAFEADQGTTSACSGACAVAWPPVTTTSASAEVGTGVTQSLVGHAKRADGSTQITYAGHPLYLFKGDSAPGDANGQGSTAFGARWDAVTPAGQEVTSGG